MPQDNALDHTIKIAVGAEKERGFASDNATSGYHLFLKLKKHLCAERCSDNNEFIDVVQD